MEWMISGQGLQFSVDFVGIGSARNPRPVSKENRRSSFDIQFLAEFTNFFIRECTIVLCLFRHFVVDHPVFPCLCRVAGTPDISGNFYRLFGKDVVWIQINCYIIDIAQIVFKLFAIAAVRIGKNSYFPFSVSFDDLYGQVFWKVREIDDGNFPEFLVRIVFFGLKVHDSSDKQILRLFVRIDEIVSDLDFIQS